MYIFMRIKRPICWIFGHVWSKDSKPAPSGLECLFVPFLVLMRARIPSFVIHTCERCSKEKIVEIS